MKVITSSFKSYFLLLYSHEQQYIHIYMQKHNDAITTSGHSSLEKYTSHFIRNGWKGLRRVICERWVGDWTKTATYWTPAPPAIAVCLFRSPGPLNPGPRGPASLLGAGSHRSIWNTDFKLWTPTAWLPVSPRVISLFYVHSIQPIDSQGYPLISSTGCTCYLHRGISHLTAWPDRRSICNTTSESLLRITSGSLTYASLQIPQDDDVTANQTSSSITKPVSAFPDLFLRLSSPILPDKYHYLLQKQTNRAWQLRLHLGPRADQLPFPCYSYLPTPPLGQDMTQGQF